MSETNKLSRSEQARVNGAKSRGPTSPEGKAKSSRNALKHGFAATINVLLTIEDVEEFHCHVDGIRNSFGPRNHLESSLVDRLAAIIWRQSRLDSLEPALIEAQMKLQRANICAVYPTAADDPYLNFLQAWQALARPPQKMDSSREKKDPSLLPDGYDINSMELLYRYQTSLTRQFNFTMGSLKQYRKDFAPDVLVNESNADLPIGGVPAPVEVYAPVEVPVAAPVEEEEAPTPVSTQDEPDSAPPPAPEIAPMQAPKPKTIVIYPLTTAKIDPQPLANGPVRPVTPINKR